MRRLIAFLILASIKGISHVLYPGSFTWLTEHPKDDPFKDIRLMIFLNHTSLYEPLFLQALSFSYLWHLAAVINVPGADVTLERPVVGTFYKLMIPNISPITRKKDESWDNYLATIHSDSIVIIAPEGRMKRPGGLDKFGKPMTVKGGVADIIFSMNEGSLLLCLSGGLHHVQVPGQPIPNFFRRIRMNLARFEINDYKSRFSKDPREAKIQIVQDLQERLERDCPTET